MSTIVIDHLARVEGHGGITVELDGDAVSNVRFDVFEGARLLDGLVRASPHRGNFRTRGHALLVDHSQAVANTNCGRLRSDRLAAWSTPRRLYAR